MNPPENIVTDLEVSKELKKNGFNKETVFYWGWREEEWFFEKRDKTWISLYDEIVPAPTAEEIKLPEKIEINRVKYFINIHSLKSRLKRKTWSVVYRSAPHKVMCGFNDKKLCNAMAQMYNYLAENKLIEVKQ